MVIKTTLLATLMALSLATTPLHAQAGDNGCSDILASSTASQPLASSTASQPESKPVDTLAMQPAPGVPGDVFGARGPNPHARELRDIAIYNSIGNEDGVAMLSAQLHQFGVTKQAIQRSIDQTNVHAPAPAPAGMRASMDHPGAHADAGWQASQ